MEAYMDAIFTTNKDSNMHNGNYMENAILSNAKPYYGVM